MKKPKKSLSKKGAIFNILWLLVENPNNRHRFRKSDIREDLICEFGIELDVKTIKDYLDILQDLELEFKIEHDTNKGYYISERRTDENHRDMLINLIKNANGLGEQLEAKLLDFVTHDMSKEQRKKYLNPTKKIDGDTLIDNINIIRSAIDEGKKISFEYLSFDKFGKLQKNGIHYTVTPEAITYINGIYYLQYTESYWTKYSYDIKIQYMANIQKSEFAIKKELENTNNKEVFEVEILYDWAIEFINEHFKKYEILRRRSFVLAVIETSYYKMVQWAKQYSRFFIVRNQNVRNEVIRGIRESYIFNYYYDDICTRVKSAIIDYYYSNINCNLLEYDKYFNNLYATIDEYLEDINYELVKKIDNIKIYSVGNRKIAIGFIENANFFSLDNGKVVLSNSKGNSESAISLSGKMKDLNVDDRYIFVFQRRWSKIKPERPGEYFITLPNNNKTFIKQVQIMKSIEKSQLKRK